MVTSRFGKKGGIANFIVFFGATIAIVVILLVYVFGAGVVKKLNNAGSDVAVFDEVGVEVDNVFNYSERYVNLTEARFLIADDLGVKNALRMVNYEK